MLVFVMFIGAVLASGCGSAPYYVVVESPRQIVAPPANTARVYFIAKGGSGWAGKSEVFILRENRLIGYLQIGQMFIVDLPPGEHLFMSVTSNSEAVKATLAGGKTYYIQAFSTPGAASIMWGHASQNVHLQPVVPGSQEWLHHAEWIGESTCVTLNKEKAPKWEVKYAEKVADRLAKVKSGEIKAKVMTPEMGE
jgi:hypothetical protein